MAHRLGDWFLPKPVHCYRLYCFYLILSILIVSSSNVVDALDDPIVQIDSPQGVKAFGQSIAVKGDTLAVGAPGNSRVFIYDLTQASQVQADLESGFDDSFGARVTLSDPETLLVGSAQGATLYRKSTISESATWEANAFFNYTLEQSLQPPPVSLSRDTVAVGGLVSESDAAGMVYLYDKGGDTSSDITYTRTVVQVQDQPKTFGTSLDLDRYQSILVVGCPNDSRKARSAGAVYVFRIQQDLSSDSVGGLLFNQDTVIPLQEIESSFPHDEPIDDYFGSAVAVKGDWMAVSAHGKDDFRGAVYLFSSKAPYELLQKLTAPDAAVGASFGQALALTETTLVVGAKHANSKTGQVYLYQLSRNKNSWSLVSELQAPDGVSGDLFGDSVAVSGTTVAVGASTKLNVQDGSDTTTGAAYIFTPPYPSPPNQKGSNGWIYIVAVVVLLVVSCVCLRRRALRRREQRRLRRYRRDDEMHGGELELQEASGSQSYADEPDSSVI